MLVEVQNRLQAGVGDRVEIAVPTGTLLKLSMLVYFLPIIALIVGAYAAGEWAAARQADPTLASIIGGGATLAVVFFLLQRLDRRRRARAEYQPRMTRLLASAGSPPDLKIDDSGSKSGRTANNAAPH
jgi:sigma-E factor negative regulatory protein RseC